MALLGGQMKSVQAILEKDKVTTSQRWPSQYLTMQIFLVHIVTSVNIELYTFILLVSAVMSIRA